MDAKTLNNKNNDFVTKIELLLVYRTGFEILNMHKNLSNCTRKIDIEERNRK